MSTPTGTSSPSSLIPTGPRLFYSLASLLLLALSFVGFKLFYLQGMAYPGHPLPPPTRTLLIVHGLIMSAWILLAVVQPWLVACGKRKLHMSVGKAGACLAALVFVVGIKTGIEAARITPPDLVRFSLAPKAFLMVPLSSIVLFGVFVIAGVVFRKRPAVHRPMMFLSSVTVVSAALGRITPVNAWLAGSLAERCFSAFASTLILTSLLWVVKSLWDRQADRWLGMGLCLMAVWFAACSQIAKSGAWLRVADALLG